MDFTPQDLNTLQERGIKPETVQLQLRQLKTGFPYLRVLAPATPGNGILRLEPSERDKYVGAWKRFLAQGGTVVKMVPASGAASRMFKNLFAFAADGVMTPFIEQFVNGLHEFAFFPELDATCRRLYGESADALIEQRRAVDVVKALITPEGMDYGQLPKALLTFHRDGEGGVRTPLEEHLAEGAGYAAGADGVVRVHFTVSPDHMEAMQKKIEESVAALEKKYGVKYEVEMSVQKPSTDTVSLGPDGEAYREDGELFFRPAGHGALLENLAELPQEVVFIKNIDNVVPDSRRASTIEYKQVLGGVLVETRQRIEHYASELKMGLPSRAELDEMLDFMHDVLFVTGEGASEMDDLELADYLLCKFDRPLRVCGMVRNEGEPGGGPFLAYGPDGTVQPQILESTQLNPSAPDTKRLLDESTHFNPVDLVCFLRDLDGEPYELPEYRDPETGFISEKSRKGVDIKALELPGLWNGSMSDWNTLLVEVPADTFNPVKTVNDLLRPIHKG